VLASAAAAVFLALALFLIPTLGLQNDETLFANGIYAPVMVADSLRTPAGSVPLMLVSYTGSLKTWLFALVFALFEPSLWSVRLPVALIGAATVAIFVRQTARTAGTLAGLVGAGLLATDPAFLLTVCFDWGPVALQVFLSVASVASFMAYFRTGRRRWALLAGLLAGLAIWNKALFLWSMAGLAAASAAVCFGELRRRLTPAATLAAAAGFVGGAWPLLLYNWRTEGATFSRNVGWELSPPYVLYKLRVLLETLDGAALFGYMLDTEGAAPASGLAAAFLALSAGVALIPALRRQRPAAWAVIAFWAAYLPMFLGRDVGGGSHHVALLWPLPHLALAVAAGRWAGESAGRRRVTLALLAAGMLLNLRYVAEFRREAARSGPAVIWTDAIDDLHERLEGLRPRGVAVLDWGMFAQLRALGQGRLPLVWGADAYLRDRQSPEAVAFAQKLLAEPGYVFVDHVEGRRVFAGVRERFDANLRRSGKVSRRIATIYDDGGRPTFELFRVETELAGEVEVDGAVDVFVGQPGRGAFVVGDVLDDQHHVARIAGAQHLAAAVGEAALADVGRLFRRPGHAFAGADGAQDVVEDLRADDIDLDLVLDAAQERFVGELPWIEVGREDDERLERDGDLDAGAQREEVDAAVQRHDPAVEQVARVDHLAAEVVDDEQAVVGLHLQGRGVVAERALELQLEHFLDHFAADRDAGARAADPARVLAVQGFERVVDD
jgi:4-amino-4-deoxy-L-arabinose transferase-like glycosyltransferase